MAHALAHASFGTAGPRQPWPLRPPSRNQWNLRAADARAPAPRPAPRHVAPAAAPTTNGATELVGAQVIVANHDHCWLRCSCASRPSSRPPPARARSKAHHPPATALDRSCRRGMDPLPHPPRPVSLAARVVRESGLGQRLRRRLAFTACRASLQTYRTRRSSVTWISRREQPGGAVLSLGARACRQRCPEPLAEPLSPEQRDRRATSGGVAAVRQAARAPETAATSLTRRAPLCPRQATQIGMPCCWQHVANPT